MPKRTFQKSPDSEADSSKNELMGKDSEIESRRAKIIKILKRRKSATVEEIIQELNDGGFDISEPTLKKDIAALKQSGYDIYSRKKHYCLSENFDNKTTQQDICTLKDFSDTTKLQLQIVLYLMKKDPDIGCAMISEIMNELDPEEKWKSASEKENREKRTVNTKVLQPLYKTKSDKEKGLLTCNPNKSYCNAQEYWLFKIPVDRREFVEYLFSKRLNNNAILPLMKYFYEEKTDTESTQNVNRLTIPPNNISISNISEANNDYLRCYEKNKTLLRFVSNYNPISFKYGEKGEKVDFCIVGFIFFSIERGIFYAIGKVPARSNQNPYRMYDTSKISDIKAVPDNYSDLIKDDERFNVSADKPIYVSVLINMEEGKEEDKIEKGEIVEKLKDFQKNRSDLAKMEEKDGCWIYSDRFQGKNDLGNLLKKIKKRDNHLKEKEKRELFSFSYVACDEQEYYSGLKKEFQRLQNEMFNVSVDEPEEVSVCIPAKEKKVVEDFKNLQKHRSSLAKMKNNKEKGYWIYSDTIRGMSDFARFLRRYGSKVSVIQSERLKKQMKTTTTNVFKRYDEYSEETIQ